MTAAGIDPDFARELARALRDGPQVLIAVVNRRFLALPGVTTVTWLATAPDHSVMHRIGTSHASVFPIGGFDPIIDDDPWCQRIFAENAAVSCDGREELFSFLPREAEALMARGYGFSYCAPIVIADGVRGTVNLLGEAGGLTANIAQIEALLPLAALIFTFPGIERFERG